MLEVEGIERIKNHILAEADRTVRSIEEESRQLVEKETLECERECQKILAEAKERADHDADLLVKRGESIADAERRKRDLAGKQEIVDGDYACSTSCCKSHRRRRRSIGLDSRLEYWEGVITLSANENGARRCTAEGTSRRTVLIAEEGDFAGGLMVTPVAYRIT